MNPLIRIGDIIATTCSWYKTMRVERVGKKRGKSGEREENEKKGGNMDLWVCGVHAYPNVYVSVGMQVLHISFCVCSAVLRFPLQRNILSKL